jgi:hypothetical protein
MPAAGASFPRWGEGRATGGAEGPGGDHVGVTCINPSPSMAAGAASSGLGYGPAVFLA